MNADRLRLLADDLRRRVESDPTRHGVVVPRATLRDLLAALAPQEAAREEGAYATDVYDEPAAHEDRDRERLRAQLAEAVALLRETCGSEAVTISTVLPWNARRDALLAAVAPGDVGEER